MLTETNVMDRYFLDCRCALLEVAAIMDRLPSSDAACAADERLRLLRQAIAILADPGAGPDRAERILHLMSDPIG